MFCVICFNEYPFFVVEYTVRSLDVLIFLLDSTNRYLTILSRDLTKRTRIASTRRGFVFDIICHSKGIRFCATCIDSFLFSFILLPC